MGFNSGFKKLNSVRIVPVRLSDVGYVLEWKSHWMNGYQQLLFWKQSKVRTCRWRSIKQHNTRAHITFLLPAQCSALLAQGLWALYIPSKPSAIIP